MNIIKLNGWFINENAISSVKINDEKDMAVIFLTEIADGESQSLHLHGEDAVGMLEMYLDLSAVRIAIDNDPVPQATIVD